MKAKERIGEEVMKNTVILQELHKAEDLLSLVILRNEKLGSTPAITNRDINLHHIRSLLCASIHSFVSDIYFGAFRLEEKRKNEG